MSIFNRKKRKYNWKQITFIGNFMDLNILKIIFQYLFTRNEPALIDRNINHEIKNSIYVLLSSTETNCVDYQG